MPQIRTTASGNGGDAFGIDLWAAEVFISQYPDGSGVQTARNAVTILNPDENLVRGDTIDLLSTVVLDLNGVVCLNVQYICVDLYKGSNPQPDFTLEGVTRSCQGFTCKGKWVLMEQTFTGLIIKETDPTEIRKLFSAKAP